MQNKEEIDAKEWIWFLFLGLLAVLFLCVLIYLLLNLKRFSEHALTPDSVLGIQQFESEGLRKKW